MRIARNVCRLPTSRSTSSSSTSKAPATTAIGASFFGKSAGSSSPVVALRQWTGWRAMACGPISTNDTFNRCTSHGRYAAWRAAPPTENGCARPVCQSLKSKGFDGKDADNIRLIENGYRLLMYPVVQRSDDSRAPQGHGSVPDALCGVARRRFRTRPVLCGEVGKQVARSALARGDSPIRWRPGSRTSVPDGAVREP